MSDLVVVGSGLYGITAARVAAEQGYRVTVIEKRDHIGGNAFDQVDEFTGIEIHRYGAHIFHTSNERVWSFLSRFTEWVPYEHRVWTRHAGETYSMPINLHTLSQFFGRNLSPTGGRALLTSKVAADLERMRADAPTRRLMLNGETFESKAVAAIGRELYEAFIEGYTEKQWQTPANELPAEVFGRLPVRYNFDSRYFSDTHQALPLHGYTAMMERMLDHSNISVHTSSDVFEPRLGQYSMKLLRKASLPIVYTGPIDRYFDFQLGHLGWRTVDFEWETREAQDVQGAAVINEADTVVPYTRTIEFKHFHPERTEVFNSQQSVIAREFSRFAKQDDEPYYPINAPADREKLRLYRALAGAEREHGVIFGGRLGSYQYLDMHAAVASALTMMDREFPLAH